MDGGVQRVQREDHMSSGLSVLNQPGDDARASAEAVAVSLGRGLPILVEARWLLGYVLVVEATLQFLLKAWSEVFEILLFVFITGGFLVVTCALKGVRGLTGMVTDTWTQRLAALFLGALAVSFLWGDHSVRSVLALLRLPTYLIVIAMMVESMRDGERRILPLAWIVLGGVSFVYALAFIEFYWGSDILGLECADAPKCLQFKTAGWHWHGLFSGRYASGIRDFARHGGILNATVIGESYGLNRLGLFGILAYSLGMGIILNSDDMRRKSVAGGLLTFVLLGVMLSGSRSATLVIGGLWLVLAVLVGFYGRTLRLVRTCIVTHLVIFAALFALWRAMPEGITAIDRLLTPARSTFVRPPRGVSVEPPVAGGSSAAPGETVAREPAPRQTEVIYDGRLVAGTERFQKWRLALDVFLARPAGGAGYRTYPLVYRQAFPGLWWTDAGVHSGYLKVLVEAGLMGALPLLALLVCVLVVMSARDPGLSAAGNVWRVAFLSALVGMLTINVVDTHAEDRFFWMVLAFAAVLEVGRRRAAAPAAEEAAAERAAVDKAAVDEMRPGSILGLSLSPRRSRGPHDAPRRPGRAGRDVDGSGTD